MKIIELEEATDSLRHYAQGVSDEPLVLAINRSPVAALVALPNTDIESVRVSTNQVFIRTIEESRRRHAEEGGISLEKMKRRLDGRGGLKT